MKKWKGEFPHVNSDPRWSDFGDAPTLRGSLVSRQRYILMITNVYLYIYIHIFIYISSGCATRLAKSKQPLSHSATLPEWLDQPLSHSATLPERLDQPLSHSATLSNWVAEWLVQPLLPERLSGWVAEWLWLSGWSSRSGRAAEWLSGCTKPLWQNVSVGE